MRLPDFLIIGAQKAGSSWLIQRMAQHPEIFIEDKELMFFNVDQYFARGTEWYASHFAKAGERQVVGEKTPDYFIHRKRNGQTVPTMDRIKDLLPEARILIVLRNPVTRAFSALRHHLWFRRFSPHEKPCDLMFSEAGEEWNILSYGFYAQHLAHCRSLFAEDQIKIWIFEEDIVKNPQQVLREAFAHVGVDPKWQPDHKIGKARNRGVSSHLALRGHYHLPLLGDIWQVVDMFAAHKYALDAECQARLQDLYRDDILRLEEMLGRDLSVWRD
ncbi:sulfotransferase [Magnetospira thiophila]